MSSSCVLELWVASKVLLGRACTWVALLRVLSVLLPVAPCLTLLPLLGSFNRLHIVARLTGTLAQRRRWQVIAEDRTTDEIAVLRATLMPSALPMHIRTYLEVLNLSAAHCLSACPAADLAHAACSTCACSTCACCTCTLAALARRRSTSRSLLQPKYCTYQLKVEYLATQSRVLGNSK